MEVGSLQEVKTIIKSLIISSPKALSIEKLDRDYYDVEGQLIPHRELGFNSLEEFLNSMPDTVEILGSGPTATVRIALNKKSEHIYEIICDQRIPKSPSKKKRNRKTHQRGLQDLVVQTNCDTETNQTTSCVSVNKREAANNYNIGRLGDAFKTSLKIGGDPSQQSTKISQNDMRSRNISNNKEATGATIGHNRGRLELDNTSCSLYNNENASISKGADQRFREISHSNYKWSDDLDAAVPESATSNLLYYIDFPEHMVPCGKKIPPYRRTHDIECGSRLAIFISEIHSPFKFWFHVYKEGHELDVLMQEMQHFYAPLETEEFRVSEMHITPGQVCAASLHGLWHRAEVLSLVAKDGVKVSLVDYGTVCEVPIYGIKYLAKSFARLPSQALRGSLSHLKSMAPHWDDAASSCFAALVKELILYAQISEIDNVNGVFYMVLCDTHDSKVVQINRDLVERGHALYDKNWQEALIKMSRR